MTTAGRPTGLEIAIVGMAARLPGAGDVEAYWDMLREGREGITHLSDAELRAAGLGDERLRDPALIRSLGLLQDVERFDADFFGYSARDAEILDPQQRLFLEEAWKALENAGYAPEKFDGAVGVFAGCGLSAYTLKLVASGWFLRQQIGFQKAVANDKDHLSTATAYKLGLTGPAVTVQTTCSTSLVAVHLACRSLLSGECDLALAGGVTAGLELGSVVSYQEGNILSMDGRCRPFDAQASGTVVSNGVGLVVLRRLDDATRDRDNIRAVICASAINNDGSVKVGYLSPSVSGQYKVIRQALRLAGVEPDTIDYVEAHGTATLKGDPIEVRALTRAYREQTSRTQYCALGSVKGNIGHPDTAAGVAGLIKAVMAIEHATIPATPHFQAPNPELELEGSPFYVNETAVPWPQAGRPRRAAVSSFGLGGTNAHLILEQAPERSRARVERGEQLVLLSAKTPSALATIAGRLARCLRHDANIAIEDVAFTLRQGRADLTERAFFVGSRAQIIDQLLAFDVERVRSDRPTASHQPAWVVEGTLAQWWALVSAYDNASPSFHDLVARHAPLFAAAGVRIADAIADGAAVHPPDDTVTRLAVGYLLGRHLLQVGIDLQAIVPTDDHELIAACVAGALTIEDGLRIARLLRNGARDGFETAAAEAELHDVIRSLTPLPPRIGYLSCVTGTWHAAGRVADHAYWRDVCRAAWTSGAGVDPDRTAGLCLVRTGQGDSFDLLPEASTPADHHRRALWIVGELWRRGHVLRREAAATGGRRIVLPAYPFEGKRYWIDTDDGASPPRAEAPARSADSSSVAERFYVPTWRQCADVPLESPASPEANANAEGSAGSYVIFAAPGDPCAAAFVDDVQGAARRMTLVHDTRSGAANGAAFILDGTNGGDYTRLVRHVDLSRTHANCFVIFDSFLEALGAAFGRHGPGAWFCAPMFLAQALGEVSLEGGVALGSWPPIELILVSKAMWTLNGEEPVYPEKALARALGTVIAQEYPNLAFRTIDLPAVGSEAYATGRKRQLLTRELRQNSGIRHVALRGRHRWEQVFTPVRPHTPAPGKLRHAGVYLITGGLGGIGLEIAEYLAREFQARIVLVGRSAFPADTEWADRLADAGSDPLTATLRRLMRIRELGGDVRVFPADVTDRTAMLEVKRSAERAFGPINGIVHAAGCMPESIVQRMTGASAWRGLQAKVDGTRVLATLFDGEPLDFLCLFSSLRAITGGVGNGDYAAANAYMDAFAEQAWIEDKAPVVSVNWDGWAGVGMTTRIKAGLAKQSIEPALMPVEQALAAFAGALSLSCPRVAVSSVPIDELLAAPSSLAAAQGAWIETPADARSEASQRPDHLDAPYVAPRNQREAWMVSIWEQLFGVRPIGVLDSFSALGGDSVTGLQIAAKAAESGIRVGPFQAMEDDTIAVLCEHLDAEPSVAAAMEPAAVAGMVPLTPIQQWYFDRALANPNHFNQAFMLRPLRTLDGGCLARAFEALLRHHDALRSRFYRTAEGWMQCQVEQVAGASFRIEDLRAAAPESRAARIADSCAAEQATLDLDTATVVKAVFFDCGDPVHDRLMICAHHLVVDAISWRVLMDDLQTSYGQAERDEPIRLPAKSTAFKSWAEALRAYADTSRGLTGLDYWTRTLMADRRQVPRDFPRGDNTVGSTAIASREIALEGSVALTQRGATAQSVFLAALGSAIEDWVGPGSVLVELEGHGRASADIDADLSRTVGWFTALHPFAIPARREHAEQKTVAAVQAALDAVPNYGVDYGVLAYLCGDPIRHAPRADVLVLYLGQGGRGAGDDQLFGMADESPGWTQDPANERSHVLEILASVRDSKLSLSVMYSKALHDAATIESLIDRFVLFYQSYAPLAYCGQEA
jgi:non-ribosomal peptide synthase protein (TIGR01720 family)